MGVALFLIPAGIGAALGYVFAPSIRPGHPLPRFTVFAMAIAAVLLGAQAVGIGAGLFGFLDGDMDLASAIGGGIAFGLVGTIIVGFFALPMTFAHALVWGYLVRWLTGRRSTSLPAPRLESG